MNVERSETNKRIDRICFALILLLNELRSNIKTENGEVVAAIPVVTLDQIEKLILAQGGAPNG